MALPDLVTRDCSWAGTVGCISGLVSLVVDGTVLGTLGGLGEASGTLGVRAWGDRAGVGVATRCARLRRIVPCSVLTM
ncbi:hypothetical protein ElyMa_002965100 [Elysia marginata]|uniref:Uncharacterized protein n=1 Tax=Elysia marginata TaxID=1093978 RepID=A0AAV4IA82_9GAST|nr:hypothetical protein ElyMa_002965100 [Elysia marginata]